MIDERFWVHRLKSTSLAGVLGALSMGFYTLYELIVNNQFRNDLMVFLSIMAVTKLAALLYFRHVN